MFNTLRHCLRLSEFEFTSGVLTRLYIARIHVIYGLNKKIKFQVSDQRFGK